MDAPKLPPLNSREMAEIIRCQSSAWEWEPRLLETVLGKLTRGSTSISPLSESVATEIITLCREGWGLDHALKENRVTHKAFFAWIAKSHSAAPDAAIYRNFRLRLRDAFLECSAERGAGTEKQLLQLGLTAS